MPRSSAPWFRSSKKTWYCTFGGRKVSLGVRGEENRKQGLRPQARLVIDIPSECSLHAYHGVSLGRAGMSHKPKSASRSAQTGKDKSWSESHRLDRGIRPACATRPTAISCVLATAVADGGMPWRNCRTAGGRLRPGTEGRRFDGTQDGSSRQGSGSLPVSGSR